MSSWSQYLGNTKTYLKYSLRNKLVCARARARRVESWRSFSRFIVRPESERQLAIKRTVMHNAMHEASQRSSTEWGIPRKWLCKHITQNWHQFAQLKITRPTYHWKISLNKTAGKTTEFRQWKPESGIIFNPLIATLKPQSNGPWCSNTVIGTLAVDGWAVTFGTARRGLNEATARPGPSSLYQM